MVSRNKSRALQLLAGVAVAFAVAPWLGAGAAQATTPSTDGSCSTRPGSVPSGAACGQLTSGSTSLGEVWSWRTDADELKVIVFNNVALDSPGAINACVSATTAFADGAACTAGSAGNILTTDSTKLDLLLGQHGVLPDAKVFYAIGVHLGDESTGVTGSWVGVLPNPSGSPSNSQSASGSPTTTSSESSSASASGSSSESSSASASGSSSESSSASASGSSSESSSVSASSTSSSSASASVSASSTGSSGVSVLPTAFASPADLAHTGPNGATAPSIALSVALLGLGAALVLISTRPARRH